MTPNPILSRLGLTPEQVAANAVRVGAAPRSIEIVKTRAAGKTESLPPAHRHHAGPLERLNYAEVKGIRDRVAAGEKLMAISEEFGITVPAVSRIARGLTYQDAPGPLTGRHPRARFNSKLSDEDLEAIRASRKNGRTFQAIARDFGVPYSTVHRIVTGRVYRAEGGAR